MKAITIHVDEGIYKEYKKWAGKTHQTTSGLIREAMANYAQKHSRQNQPSLADGTEPASVGGIRKNWRDRSDLLEDYFEKS